MNWELLRNASQEQWEEFCEKEPEKLVDLDKSWDGINFILTGGSVGGRPVHVGSILGNIMRSLLGQPAPEPVAPTSESLHWVMQKGEDLSPNLSDGYDNRLQLISAAHVKDVANALENLSEDEMRSRFNAPAMSAAGVYLGEFWNRDPDESWIYLIENYRILKSLFLTAAAENSSIIRYCS